MEAKCSHDLLFVVFRPPVHTVDALIYTVGEGVPQLLFLPVGSTAF